MNWGSRVQGTSAQGEPKVEYRGLRKLGSGRGWWAKRARAPRGQHSRVKTKKMRDNIAPPTLGSFTARYAGGHNNISNSQSHAKTPQNNTGTHGAEAGRETGRVQPFPNELPNSLGRVEVQAQRGEVSALGQHSQAAVRVSDDVQQAQKTKLFTGAKGGRASCSAGTRGGAGGPGCAGATNSGSSRGSRGGSSCRGCV